MTKQMPGPAQTPKPTASWRRPSIIKVPDGRPHRRSSQRAAEPPAHLDLSTRSLSCGCRRPCVVGTTRIPGPPRPVITAAVHPDRRVGPHAPVMSPESLDHEPNGLMTDRRSADSFPTSRRLRSPLLPAGVRSISRGNQTVPGRSSLHGGTRRRPVGPDGAPHQ